MLKKNLYSLLLAILPLVFLTGQAQSPFQLPFPMTNQLFQPLPETFNENLQEDLRRKINENSKWAALVAKKKMAVGLVDISDPYAVKFARINGNEMMYAASLPKIAILLSAMDAIEKGELKETAEIRADLRIMISKSSNSAATRMIDRLGYEKIADVLTDPKYDFYDKAYGGGLWVGKRYAKEGRRYPDPIKGLSHAATVTQVCRFYYMLAYGRLVNYQRSEEMLKIMGNPELHHKFVNALDRIAPNAQLFRKSGSWKNFHSDSILVWGSSGRRYILVALVDDPEGETIIRQLVEPVEEVLYGPIGMRNMMD